MMMNNKVKRKNIFGILSVLIAIFYLFISKTSIINILFCFLIVLSFVFSIISLRREDIKIMGILGIILSIIDSAILISFCFFGPSTYKSAVIDNKSYSYNDFKEMSNEELTSYLLKDITITASISKIDVSLVDDIGINKIYFAEGWVVEIPKSCYRIEKLEVDDRVRVISKINRYVLGKVYLSNYTKDNNDNVVSCDTVIQILA